MSQSRLYVLLLVACGLGFIYLILVSSFAAPNLEVCPIKAITSYPCPSCGSTKSVMALFKGSFKTAWFHNPFGFLILPIMTITPFWVLFDWFRKDKSLWLFYTRLETLLKKKALAIPLVILALLNWGWNIIKHNL